MIARLVLPAALRARIAAEARDAAPRECCGLIEGHVAGGEARGVQLHPSPNLSAAADRFEIDPTVQIAAQRGARERGTAIIGCYHSHPDGAAEPSARDRDGATEQEFIWLIAAPGDGVKAYVFADAGFRPIPIVGPDRGPDGFSNRA